MENRDSIETKGHAIPKSIINLEAVVASLPTHERERFDRLFDFNTSTACIQPPKTMEHWLAKAFKDMASTPEGVLSAQQKNRPATL